MDRPSDLCPEWGEVFAMDRPVIWEDSPRHQDGYEGGDDGAYAALGELAFPIHPHLGQAAVLVVPTAADARAEDSILNSDIAPLERLEDDIRTHSSPHRQAFCNSPGPCAICAAPLL